MHCWNFAVSMRLARVCCKASYLKAYFDGSYHNDGKSCAGIVIFYRPIDTAAFRELCSISVPLAVESACQAELAAMLLTTLTLKLMLKGDTNQVVKEVIQQFVGIKPARVTGASKQAFP